MGNGNFANILTGLLVWWWTTDSPGKLVVYIDPAVAAVVKREGISNLAVSYNGKPVIADVTAFQVSLWNSGDGPIRAQNILSKVCLKVADRSPILEATIRKKSREVIGIQLEQHLV